MGYSVKYIWSKVLKKLRGAAIIDSSVDSLASIQSGTDFVNSKIGRYSFCGYDCHIINAEIGSFCSIADDVKIGGARHPMEWVSTSSAFYSKKDCPSDRLAKLVRNKDKKVIIENDVWIGNNAIILQGVTIHTGAVIGAGAIVTKDVPPYAIVAGNPAVVIRMRFEKDIIDGLLESQWWNMSESDLLSNVDAIPNPSLFLKKINKG